VTSEIDCTKLTQKLISFPSITPISAGCIEYIADLLQQHGFITHVVKFGPEDQQVTNLYAVHGETGPNICFAGHIDVVPTGPLDQWQYHPFSATIEGDKLYGRGAVDMKAAIAAMIVASNNFLSNNKLKCGSISFLLTSDEEGPAKYGIKPMIDWLKQHNHKIDFCVLGEPTYQNTFGDVIQIGRRGSASFALEIRGIQGHVAYDNFINPNLIAIKVLNALTELELDKGHGVFVPSKLNITSIDSSNLATNVIPDKINIRFNVRYNDLHTAKSLEDLCAEVISRFTDNFNLSLVEESPQPFISDTGNEYVQLFQKAVAESIGRTPDFTTYGGASDGRFIRALCQVVEFGLASNTAHQINEYLFLKDLENLYSVYYNFLLQFFSTYADVAEWQTHQT